MGDIALVKDRQSTVNDVANGLPILYRVRFPIQNPLPKLKAIYYNNQLICNGQSDFGEFVTTITLEHTLYTGLAAGLQNQAQPQQYQPNQQQQQQYQPVQIQSQGNFNQIPNPQRPAATQRPILQNTQRPPVRPPVQNGFDSFSNSGSGSGSGEKFSDINTQCGVPNNRIRESTGLVVNGKVAAKGQFPWLAAYYHSGYGDSGFICGM